MNDFGRAIALDGGDAVTYSIRAGLLIEQARYREAITDLSRAIDRRPTTSSVWTTRGEAWAMLGDLKRSIDDQNEALRLRPRLAIAYKRRGASWVGLGEFGKALADFDAAISIATGVR